MTGDPITQERFATLIERQRGLEAQAMSQGADNFRKRLNEARESKTSSTVGGSKKLLSEAVGRVEEGIIAMLAEAAKKTGPRHSALAWCAQVGPDVAAYMTVKAVLDTLSDKMSMRDVANEISSLLVDELRFRRFKEKAPGLFEYRMNSFSTSNYAHMARSMTATITHADIDVSDLEMTPSVKLLVGVKLLDVLIQTTGMVEVVTRRIVKRGPRPVVRQEQLLVPAPETLEWLTKRNDAMALMCPINMPMVVPPLQWAPKQRGGYRFSLRSRYQLARSMDKTHRKQVEAADMPLVYGAVNNLQETPWRVNTEVLKLVNAIKLSGRAMAGVPAFSPEAMPGAPIDVDTNPDARKAHRKAKHQIHERNHLRLVRTVEHSHTLDVAETFQYDEAIFFPYNLDFRGRVYPICSYLSPQGGDLAKALLHFAEGKPLGIDGAEWLAIHGANLLDTTQHGEKISRYSLSDRAQWIRDHSDDIIDAANDPFGAPWWADAEKPLQFYAFCCEWRDYMDLENYGRGAEFVSSLPVSQDGSCNGLQHFSALFHDPIGGAAVNLIPGDLPRDIYQHIADDVKDRLEAIVADPARHGLRQIELTKTDKDGTKSTSTVPAVASDATVAATWLSSGLVTRKLTKRPTMTFGYGSKKYGFQDQTRDYMKGHKDWQTIRAQFATEDGTQYLHDACAMMAELIWESLTHTVVAAAQGMDWMQRMVTGIVATGQPVEWRVPSTQFPVRQHYFELEKKQIKTILAGKTVKPSFYEATETILPQKQRNAIAPNVIHSLDAAALMLAVDQASKAGVTCFGMVHDSYATHAADTGILADCTREAFVGLYTDNNVVAILSEQWASQSKDATKCPPPPAQGNLDLSLVLQSNYFFA